MPMKPNPLPFEHPCFSNAGGGAARMHLAVAPRCNIKCGFCRPTVSPCVHGCAPGLSNRLLSPEEAVAWVRQVQEERGVEIAIVGIAGPGEPLCNLETFQTIAQVRRAFPKIHICLSTNGLLLPQSVELIRQLDVETLTVTVNAVTPRVGARIYESVMGVPGEEGVRPLLENQWQGISMAVRAGLVVKINSVFVPGVNGEELPLIAQRGREEGANIQNILPLIPRERFAQQHSPDGCELRRVREEAGRSLEQFERCRHCRADAVVLADGKTLEE